MPSVFANVLSRVRHHGVSMPEEATVVAETAVSTSTNTGASTQASAAAQQQYGLSSLERLAYNQMQDAFYQPMRFSMGAWPWEAMGSTSAADQKTPVAVVEAPSREMLKRLDPLGPEEIEAIDLETEDRKLALEAEALFGYRKLREDLKAPGVLRRVLDELEIPVFDQDSVNAYKAQMVEHYRTTDKLPDPTWRLTPLGDYGAGVPKFALRKAVQIKRQLPESEIYVDHLADDPFLVVTLTPLHDFMTNVASRGLDRETQAYIEVWDEPDFEAKL